MNPSSPVIRINRNILECKLNSFQCDQQSRDGINKNILECKSFASLSRIVCVICINRNILECKFFLLLGGMLILGVLIETYWNVNKI